MTTKTKGTETLAYKFSILQGLQSAIQLHKGQFLSREQEAKIEALQTGLSFRVSKLLEDCQHKEIDLKLEAFRQMLDIIKI